MASNQNSLTFIFPLVVFLACVMLANATIPSIISVPSSSTAYASDGSCYITYLLSTEPQGSVGIDISFPPILRVASVQPLQLTLNQTNWNTGVKVYVELIENDEYEQPEDFFVNSFVTYSSAPEYEYLVDAFFGLKLTIYDNTPAPAPTPVP